MTFRKKSPRLGDAPLVQAFPLALQAYRLLTAAAAPVAPALICQRLKRHKGAPWRVRERCGQTDLSPPAGSLVWIHCASVGELLPVVPLIGCLREKGFSAGS